MNQDPYSNPLAFFAAEMKRMRAKLGITQEELAESSGFAPSTIAAVETCRLLPSEEFGEHIDPPLEGDGHFTRLRKLVEQTCVRPWFRELVEVERKAREIRTYVTYVIPGLLQTEQYIRAAAKARRPMLAEDAIGRAVALRRTRQQVLEPDGDSPMGVDQSRYPHLWAILDESVLHRVVGSPEIMDEQREHLIEMAQQPNVTIQIIPDSRGATCAYGNAFTILTTDSGSSVVYLEDFRSARYVRERDEVAGYALGFDHLRASALDDEASMNFIKGDGKWN